MTINKRKVAKPVVKPLFVRFESAERAQLEKLAEREQRSLAAQVRVLVRRGLDAEAAA